MKKLISRTLAIIVLISMLGLGWYLCRLAIYALPTDYLKPTATALLFVLVLERIGNWREKSRETKDKK